MGNDYQLSRPAASRWHDAAYWGLLSVACVVFYMLNVWTSFKEDDMEFSLLSGAGLMDLWRARWEHYLTSNGRCADFYATIFCAYLGKPLFNVVNTLVFALMGHLVVLLSVGRRSVLALALFLAMVGVCFPVPGQTMLFVAGSCNYMWAIVASLALIYLLQRYKDVEPGWGGIALLMVLAMVAGNFNEATSFGVLGGLVMFYLFNRREVDRRTLLVLAAYLAGVLVIVGSPGAWNRVAGGGISVNMGLWDLLKSRGYIFAKMMVKFVMPLFALLTVAVTLLWKGWGSIKRCKWAYILSAMAALMLLLGYLFERAYAPLSTVSFIIVAGAIDGLLSQWRHARPVRLLLVALALGVSVYAYSDAARVLYRLKAFEDGIARDIAAAPRHAVLHEYRFEGSNRFATPLRYVSTDFFNREATYCAYYDKDNVQFVGDSVFARYHTGRLLDGAVPLSLVSDRPEIADTVLAFPDQDYMVVVLNVDTLKPTPQLANYYLAKAGAGLNAEEKRFRNQHGLAADFEPHGFFPLYYQGRQLLVFPLIDEDVSHIVFQLDYDGTLGEMTLSRVLRADE